MICPELHPAFDAGGQNITLILTGRGYDYGRKVLMFALGGAGY